MNFDLVCERIAVEDIPTHPALNAAELPQVEGVRFHMVKKSALRHRWLQFYARRRTANELAMVPVDSLKTGP